MDNMDKSVQHRSVFAVPVTVQQDTPKGTWVTATGETLTVGVMPFGVTQHAVLAGETVAVTTLGTASVDLSSCTTQAATVSKGNVLVYNPNNASVRIFESTIGRFSNVIGVVLYDAAATGHAEVLLR